MDRSAQTANDAQILRIRSCSLDLDDDCVDVFLLIKSLSAFKWLHYNFSNEPHESAAEQREGSLFPPPFREAKFAK